MRKEAYLLCVTDAVVTCSKAMYTRAGSLDRTVLRCKACTQTQARKAASVHYEVFSSGVAVDVLLQPLQSTGAQSKS